MPTTSLPTAPLTHRQHVDGRPAVDSRWASVAALVTAGLLFAAYPALRPYTDETTLEGAAAFASTAWLWSHTFGMIAFAALAFAITRIVGPHQPSEAGLERTRGRRIAGAAAWLGTLLVLPYYGAETFGLRVIGARAVADLDLTLLVMAEQFRYDPLALATFAVGLLSLAVAGVALALSMRRADLPNRLGGLLTGAGLALYLPQFFGTPAMRIGHGVVLGVGCLLLASRILLGDGPALRTGRGATGAA